MLNASIGGVSGILFVVCLQGAAVSRAGHAVLEWIVESFGLVAWASALRFYLWGHHRHNSSDCFCCSLQPIPRLGPAREIYLLLSLVIVG